MRRTNSEFSSYLLKRPLDFIMAVVLLVVLFPLLALIYLLVWISLGRPVLFKQMRPGLNKKPFCLYKFRTMLEENPETCLITDEERLTRLGRFLRNTSMDELPELINVVKGDMSFVGPRPLLMKYIPRYSAEQDRRHHARPGITGWAQVNGRNEIPWKEKLKLDVWYIDKCTLMIDFKIILRTVWRVLMRSGINAPGHVTTPEFQGGDRDSFPAKSKQDKV